MKLTIEVHKNVFCVGFINILSGPLNYFINDKKSYLYQYVTRAVFVVVDSEGKQAHLVFKHTFLD